MFEYKNGILRIDFDKSALDIIWSVSFFLFMLSTICYGNFTSTNNYFYYAVFFIFLGICVCSIILNRLFWKHIQISLQSIWYALFLLLGITSSIWASSFAVTFVPVSRMIQILAVTAGMSMYVVNEERLERYLNVMLASGVYLIAYIFIKTPVDEWFDGFIGSVTGYNTNDVGCALSIVVLIAFYKFFIGHSKSMLIVCAVSFFAVIITSSRKSLFMSGLGILLIVMFNYRSKNYILRVIGAMCVVALVMFLIYQIPALYNTVGVRLDSMFRYLMSDKSVDASMAIRENYINLARMFFAQSPILGNGLNNFAYLSGLSGSTSTYSHNNYWEIAADLGAVGMLVYYWFYAYLFLKLVRQMLDGHKTALLFLSLMLLLIIFEYSMINYYKMQVQLIIAASYIATVINDRSRSDNDGKFVEAETVA